MRHYICVLSCLFFIKGSSINSSTICSMGTCFPMLVYFQTLQWAYGYLKHMVWLLVQFSGVCLCVMLYGNFVPDSMPVHLHDHLPFACSSLCLHEQRPPSSLNAEASYLHISPSPVPSPAVHTAPQKYDKVPREL